MSIFLDSANPDDVRRAEALGFIAGVTTNPTLIAREGRTAADLIPLLLRISSGIVFHQLRSGTRKKMVEEAERFTRLSDRLALKIPCTLEGLAALAELHESVPCAITAIFSPAQALLACEAGAQYIIPYVNRSTRLLGDGPALVKQMAQVVGTIDEERIFITELIAASLKSADEVVAARLAGAHHITVPWNLLETLAEHPLSQQAIEEFEAAQPPP